MRRVEHFTDLKRAAGLRASDNVWINNITGQSALRAAVR
jgi:hypothetical protein